MGKMHNTEFFISKAIAVHKDKYDYSISEYKDAYSKVKIICKIHGEFEQSPAGHLSGRGCRLCGKSTISNKLSDNKNKFIQKANIVHNNKYDYSYVEYKSSIVKIKIKCPDHGEFLQVPSSHLQGHGCKQCAINKTALNRRSNTEKFVLKSIVKHGNKYDYSLVDYSKKNLNVKIICPTHGMFQQRPDNHLDGKGCAKCSAGRGWKKSDWIEFCDNKKTEPIVYIVRCFNENEEFVKVGMTSNSIKHRFKSIPYSYEVIKIIYGSPDFVWDKEKEIHRKFIKSKHFPTINFEGYTECFDLSILEHVNS